MEELRPHDPRQVGPYRLRGRLGAGGMGEVFLAGSPGGREVVVKVVRSELAGSPKARRRFAREVAAAQRVGGYHTAQVVAADPDADPPWMVTEYIPGPSLQQLVKEVGAFSAENVRALAAQLSEGVAAIHACGLVHRDLKPGNVIMAAGGARIIDFGIARMDGASVLTEDGAVVGTYAFMSPEQVSSGDVGPASDIFSLGAVLAYAATGRSPFAAGTLPATVLRIVNAEPDLGTVTGGLRGLIAACLAKDPAARPTAAAILAGLSGGAPESAFPVPPAASPATGPRGGAPVSTSPVADGPAAGTSLTRRRLLLGGLAAAGAGAVAVPAVIIATRDSGAKAAPRRPSASPPRPVHAGVLTGHGAGVSRVTFTPDGATLLSGGVNGPIMLWDTATGRRIRTLEGHTYPVVAMELTRGGRTLVSGAEIVRVWDMAAGRETGSIATQGRDRSGFDSALVTLAATPDGRYLATDGPDGSALLWDIATGRTVRSFAGNAANSLAFTSDGRALAGGGESIRLWDVATGRALRTFPGMRGAVHLIALSPDGRFLAASGAEGPPALWEFATGRKVREFTGMGNSSGPIAFSRDARLLATAPGEEGHGPEEITLWNVATGEVDRTLNGHTGAVAALAFHPGGTALASASGDRTVRLWKLT
ncbi:serine/threonine-protein kinase [Spirillospora sp. NPDC029432]|uniref:WD40 repeat domain-containing serine/threonine protein kinase n=1 Tax=Spirillospora sp. NPDC029432 TaxID=3154599 RepID=UPI00345239B0